MSTSAATSASSAISKGQCVVCGEETYLRCEACSRFGTDWMFFCSVEHQRLMWKVHRFVCGARSNPFTFPGLTDIETERVKALWDLKDFRDMWIERLNRTAIERGKMFGSSEHMRVAYNHSVDKLGDPGVGDPLPWNDQKACFELRQPIAHQAMSNGINKVSDLETAGRVRFAMAGLPFAFVACSDFVSFEKYFEGKGPSWWSDFLHRRLILVQLYTTISKRDHPWIIYNLKSMVKFAEEVVEKSDPSVAARIMETHDYKKLTEI